MKQTLVKTVPALIALAGDAINGATVHGVTLGLLQATPPNITADLNGLIAARDIHEQAKLVLSASRSSVVVKTQMCRESIRIARDIIKLYLGTEYNEKWDALNMVGSIAVPTAMEELLPMVLAFKAYFTANSTQENALLNATAAAFQAMYDDLIAARNEVSTQRTEVDRLRDIRDSKTDRLYKRLRAMIEELALLLEPLDPRWKAFGFNMPGAEETPDVPEQVQAALIGPTAVALKWIAAARAAYYRVFMKVLGVDTEFKAVGSPSDLDMTIENLPTNATVEIQVTAINDGGESQPSATVTVITHA